MTYYTGYPRDANNNYVAMQDEEAPVQIGSRWIATDLFDGKMDDIVIYPVELRPADISLMYNQYA